MRVAVFSVKPFEREPLEAANRQANHELLLLEERLSEVTASMASGCGAVCAFANDVLSEAVLAILREAGVRLIALRSAGFNHVDIPAAERLGLTVARVPEYSPYSVAEHAVGLMLCLNRKLHRAYQRVREQNFSLAGLMGFDMHGKTVGVVGTGRIGAAACRILLGFGCDVMAADPFPSAECRGLGVRYADIDTVIRAADIITLHCPLTPETRHLIDEAALAKMKRGVMLINTSRGAVIDSRTMIAGLKSGQIGALGLDVYEEEADLFFKDLSEQVIQDDVFVRLMTFPNVLITAHQAFFTREALSNIADTTINNISDFERGDVPAANCVTSHLIAG